MDEFGLFLSARVVQEKWEDAWEMDSGRLEKAAAFLLEQIRSGIGGREELRKECRKAGFREEDLSKIFHGWGGVFYEMNRRGLLAYHPGTAKKFVSCSGVIFMDRDEARAIVLRRYFQTFAPAALEDCAAFTGYKKREILGLLGKYDLPLQPVMCGGTEYFYLGTPPGDGVIPPCLFLTGFDQMIMGYKNRACIMDEKFKRQVITVSGIVHPTVLLNGRIAARWKKDRTRLVVVPFVKMSKKTRDLITGFGEKLFANADVIQVTFE
jgi:hypothetical protein